MCWGNTLMLSSLKTIRQQHIWNDCREGGAGFKVFLWLVDKAAPVTQVDGQLWDVTVNLHVCVRLLERKLLWMTCFIYRLISCSFSLWSLLSSITPSPSLSLSLNSFVWDEWKSIYLSLSRLFSWGSGLISLWTVSDIWVFDIEAFVHFCVCGC